MMFMSLWMACSQTTTNDSGTTGPDCSAGTVATGSVVDTDGEPLAGATVYGRSEGQPEQAADADENGEFSICLPVDHDWELYAQWNSGLIYCNAAPTPYLGTALELVATCSYID